MEETEFEHIVQEMRPRLTVHCQRYLSAGTLAEEADDIVQETLVKLWKMRERLSEYQSIEALGMTIARNLCIDHLRRNKAQTASLEQMTQKSVRLPSVPTRPSSAKIRKGDSTGRWTGFRIRREECCY